MKSRKPKISAVLIVLIVAILLTPPAYAAILCSYDGPDTSEDLLQLTDFTVQGPSTLKVGDTITVSFKLKNFGQSDLKLGYRCIFAAATDPDNIDTSFGFFYAYTTLKVGETLSVNVSRTLDKAGTWTVWPSYHLSLATGEKLGPEEWHACYLNVAEKPAVTPTPSPSPTPTPTPPSVTINHSPVNVTITDNVTFTARAWVGTDKHNYVSRITIFVNDIPIRECAPPVKIPEKDCYQCTYSCGPYPAGFLTYRAEAIDSYDNKGISGEKTINVMEPVLTQPPFTVTMCFISGKMYDFPYNPNTLKIKICEAEMTGGSGIDPVTGEWRFEVSYDCKPGGSLQYVDVSPVSHREYLAYSSTASCTGTYILEPVYQPYEDECEWKGSWDPDKYIVRMNGTSQSGYDFIFEPLDLRSPDVSIEFSNDEPIWNEDVEITILTEDDMGIESVFVKIDKAYPDGSSIAGDWRRLDFTQSYDAASGLYKATAKEVFSEDSVREIVVNAMVCDIGGNRELASPQILSFGCPPINFNFWGGGRFVRSDIPIFGFPDEDGDEINDCWENAAMKELNPWIELDEEDELLEKNRRLRELSDRPYVTLDEMEAVLDHPEHKVVNFVRVTPYTNACGQKFILSYYIVTWSRDYGRFGFEEHNGDTEQLIMAWRVVDDHTLQLECIYIQAHGGCNKRDDLWEPIGVSCNEAGICSFISERAGTEETCSELEFYNNRLKLYASEDKHALYPTCQACEAVTIVIPDSGGWDWNQFGKSLVNVIGGILRAIGEAIMWVIDKIVDLFTWWEDDHLGTQVAVWDYVTLRDTPGATPPTGPEGGTPALRVEGRLTFQGSDYHYWIEYHIEKDFTNEELPHVQIVVDNLYCVDETNPERIWFFGWHNWVHDEPYVIITGFSVYPEGVSTWRAGEPWFDQVDDNENSEINSVVYEDEINPYYVIGFSAILYEDDGRYTGGGDRRNTGNDIAEELGRKLSGEEEVGGECGEHLLRRMFGVEIGEDCSGGGVYRFPVYNVGEPDRLCWIADLSLYGFPGEVVSGFWCGSNYRFCGGLGCDDDCATSILEWIKIPGRDSWRPEFMINDEVKFKGKGMPDKLRKRLERA